MFYNIILVVLKACGALRSDLDEMSWSGKYLSGQLQMWCTLDIWPTAFWSMPCCMCKCNTPVCRYEEKVEGEPDGELLGTKHAAREKLFDKGQSKRIWGELFKVVDSSDVVVQASLAHALPLLVTSVLHSK